MQTDASGLGLLFQEWETKNAPWEVAGDHHSVAQEDMPSSDGADGYAVTVVNRETGDSVEGVGDRPDSRAFPIWTGIGNQDDTRSAPPRRLAAVVMFPVAADRVTPGCSWQRCDLLTASGALRPTGPAARCAG
jgi:hypothetical protein